MVEPVAEDPILGLTYALVLGRRGDYSRRTDYMFRHSLSVGSPTLRLLAIAAIVGLSLIASPGPASAHSELIATSPTEDATLHRAPSQVRLTFGEDVMQEGSDIVVTGPGGTRYSDASTLQIEDTTASIELNDDQESGAYTVAYRIVSADGHVVEGSYEYQLSLPGSSTASPSESTAAASPDTSPAAAEQSGDAGSVWVLGLAAIGLVLVAAVVSVVIRRRRG
jgi:methionine-rich copper-binding protein CopC